MVDASNSSLKDYFFHFHCFLVFVDYKFNFENQRFECKSLNWVKDILNLHLHDLHMVNLMEYIKISAKMITLTNETYSVSLSLRITFVMALLALTLFNAGWQEKQTFKDIKIVDIFYEISHDYMYR